MEGRTDGRRGRDGVREGGAEGDGETSQFPIAAILQQASDA